MAYVQIVVNGLVLGALYACLAVGFSLVWGVLNVVNMLHGSLIVFGSYLTFFAWHSYSISPLLALPAVALLGLMPSPLDPLRCLVLPLAMNRTRYFSGTTFAPSGAGSKFISASRLTTGRPSAVSM